MWFDLVQRLIRHCNKSNFNEFTTQEKDRFFLWIPVFIGVGIALYFGITKQPPLWFSVTAPLISGVTTYYLRNNTFVFISTLIITLVFVGFSSAHLRTLHLDTSMLERPFGPAGIQGRIVSMQETTSGMKVTLENLQIARMRADFVPSRVRLHVRSKETALKTGAWVEGRAVLKPPSPPTSPGAFDFQRHSYFKGIGAIGFTYGELQVISEPDIEGLMGLKAFFDHLRLHVQARIHESFSNQDQNHGESLAITFLTGNKQVIPEDVIEDVRIAGLAHLLAISGLHIGLVSAMAFFSLRFVLAHIPPLAIRYPIKKWAAVFAIMAALFFTLLTGGSVPTIRAFIMCAIVFLGICLDRKAISLRTLAWAAIIILLFLPESLLGPSFQLSFAAVCALIAFYENRAPLYDKRPKVYRYFRDILLTSLIATLATTPFAAYHFNMVALYGVVSNLLAVPLTVFWIMPLGLMALLVMPLGGEHFFLQGMGIGIEQLVWIAKVTAEQPYALLSVPSISNASLFFMVLGGLLICLLKTRMRWSGLGALCLAMVLYQQTEHPDILISADGRLSAIHSPDQGVILSSMRRAAFVRDNWLDRWGKSKSPYTVLAETIPCDEYGCRYRAPDGLSVTLNTHPLALAEDCAKANVLITPVTHSPECEGPEAVIDKKALDLNGAHAVYLEKSGPRIVHTRDIRGERPWTLYQRAGY